MTNRFKITAVLVIAVLAFSLALRIKNKSAPLATKTSTKGASTTKGIIAPKPKQLIKTEPAAKEFKYCVDLRGVDNSYLTKFSEKVAKTLNDPRSWTIDKLIGFSQVESGCQFTVWLAAPSQMTTFGASCDVQWSCSEPPNVVINLDRWLYATDAWNKTANSIDDYRAMAINHETGHWLKFTHSNCPGAGQLAPVMRQQSIDLQGCVFNPWPTESEKQALKTRLGL